MGAEGVLFAAGLSRQRQTIAPGAYTMQPTMRRQQLGLRRKGDGSGKPPAIRHLP